MRIAKIVAIVVLAYAGLVAAFEAVISYTQPDMSAILHLTTRMQPETPMSGSWGTSSSTV